MHSKNSLAGKDMITSRKKFQDFAESREVMVSYDCSGTHDPFRELLRGFLVDEKKAEKLNKSLYQLPGLYSRIEIEQIASTIVVLFRSYITEGKNDDDGKTKVLFIMPEGVRFVIETVLNEEPKEKVIKS